MKGLKDHLLSGACSAPAELRALDDQAQPTTAPTSSLAGLHPRQQRLHSTLQTHTAVELGREPASRELLAYCLILGPWVKSHPLVFSRIDRVSSWGFCQNASIRILGHACKPNDSASVQLLFAIPVVPVAGPKSRAVACGIERLHGEWLVWICCDVMGDHSDYLCVPPAGACGIERPHGEWLVLMCCDSTDVRLELLPAESSVYMGNGWFGYAVMLWVITMITYVCLQRVLVESSIRMGNDWFWRAVRPLTCVPSGCFWNRA